MRTVYDIRRENIRALSKTWAYTWASGRGWRCTADLSAAGFHESPTKLWGFLFGEKF